MKSKLVKSGLFFLLLFLQINCSEEEVENICIIEHIVDAYDYPIKPGTPEWRLLESSQEMIDACQISFDVLGNISTEGLIETVLNYPLYGDIFLSDVNDQTGFNAVSENFNGISALLQRKDASTKLLERYRQMHPSCKENNWPSLVEPGGSSEFSFSFIEILIAQYSILNQLIPNNEYKTVMQEILEKDKQKTKYNYSHTGKEQSVLILGRLMYLLNYTPFIEEYNSNHYIKIFIDGASDFKTGTLDIVNEYAIEFLNQK